jgi:dynein assembly factor 3
MEGGGTAKLSFSESDTFSVLLVGGADMRHVMKTVAGCTQQTSKQIHFYILESSLECYARHLLFWHLLTEPLSHVGPQERTELFLELFGNSLTRAQTFQYMKNTCSSLIQLVTDEDYLRERLPFIDLSRLKFKERDMLEGIFKFWRLSDPEKKSFDIQRMWDGRVRHHLGVRYDAKDGVFDWDYHMRLTDIAPIVHSKEYKEWRHTGVAFKLRDDAPYETPNRTLASGVIVAKGGEKVAQRGYWGDIVNSPYVSIGCECDRKDMFEKKNGAYTKTSCDVAEYNLLQFLRLAFPGSITADVLRTPSSNNGHADKTSSKLAVVEEVVEDESGEGNGEEEKKHDPRGEGKDGATKGMDDGRPLVPG